MGRPRSEARLAIIAAMNLDASHDQLLYHMGAALLEQVLACKDPAARRLLLGLSEKGDPGPMAAFDGQKRKPPQSEALPRERKTACSSN